MIRPVESKIMDLDAAVAWRRQLAERGQRLVVTNGCFDLLHRGHVQYLNAARREGDALLVAVNADSSIRIVKGPSRPIIGEQDRAYLLAALECVDAVHIFSSVDARPVLSAVRPEIYAKGGDYRRETINADERVLLEQLGCELRFPAMVPGVSTTEILARLQSHSQ